jgi:SAM-dependent methyltransferase
MIQLACGDILSRTLYIAAELGVADLLASGPRTSADIANVTGVHPPSLHRVLRTLASVGVFLEGEGPEFRLTPLGETLCSDVPGSVRSWLLAHGRIIWRAIGELPYSVETGQPGFDRAYGMPVFEYFAQHPDAAALASRSMLEFHGAEAAAVASACDLADVKSLVDLGGGVGNLLEALLMANPHLTGILFELPHVARLAAQRLQAAGLNERCDVVSGDFFETPPPVADVYLLSHVIHDWDDAQCQKLLRNCRDVMPTDSRLLIVEVVLPGPNQPSLGNLLDLMMLVGQRGQERTIAQYETLVAQAGFRVQRVVPTSSAVSVIESVPFAADVEAGDAIRFAG